MQKSPRRALTLGATLGVVLAALGASPAMAGTQRVFTQTNSASGNAVVAFERAADGTLAQAETVATGGLGLGGGLASQGAVALSDDGRELIAVNAGSDELTLFRAGSKDLTRISRVASGGTRPVSVDIAGDRAYVLNAGSLDVSTFAIGADGTLTPLPGGTVALASGAGGAAQVSVAPSGDALVVTERTANRLETIPLDSQGRPGVPVVTPSNGGVPFGFDFGRRGDVVVSEAAQSTVSSYRLEGTALRLVTGSIPTVLGNACWVAVSPNGRYAYTGNTATSSVSGFAIGTDGSLTALDADGRTASAPRPNDLAFSVNGRFLYVINPGAGEVTSYRVASDGSLEPIGADSVPVGSVGIAAR